MRQRTFFRDDVSEDPRRCRVCGHYTGSRAMHVLALVFGVLSSALALYIILDVIQNWRLDGDLYRVITTSVERCW